MGGAPTATTRPAGNRRRMPRPIGMSIKAYRKRERDRLHVKRQNPEYLARQRESNRLRMRRARSANPNYGR